MTNLFQARGMLTMRYHGDSPYLRGLRSRSVDLIDDHKITSAKVAVSFALVSMVPES